MRVGNREGDGGKVLGQFVFISVLVERSSILQVLDAEGFKLDRVGG